MPLSGVWMSELPEALRRACVRDWQEWGKISWRQQVWCLPILLKNKPNLSCLLQLLCSLGVKLFLGIEQLPLSVGQKAVIFPL